MTKASIADIERILDNTLKEKGAQCIYKLRIINHRGPRKGIRDTETIAKWLCGRFDTFSKSLQTSSILRSDGKGREPGKPYFTKEHDISEATATEHRKEEKIAQHIYIASRSRDSGKRPIDTWDIANIIDYQTPINESKGNGAGKIDLLSYNADDNNLCFLELKKESSEETLLRCILEAYTYYKTIKDTIVFSNSFSHYGCNSTTSFSIAPLFFENSQPHKDFSNATPHLVELVRKIEIPVRFFMISKGVSDDVTTWEIKDVTELFGM